MTPDVVVFAAFLVLKTLDVHPCERLEVEVGQILCLTACHAQEPVCRGDAPVRCDGVEIIHPAMVDRIELVRP